MVEARENKFLSRRRPRRAAVSLGFAVRMGAVVAPPPARATVSAVRRFARHWE
jgi:hypothetical protein